MLKMSNTYSVDNPITIRYNGCMIELRQLRYFVAIAEALSFSHAAKTLYVAQPALSRQIHTLEKELGVLLFNREGNRISLTGAGRVLLPLSRAVLADVDQLLRNAFECSEGTRGRVEIGSVPYALANLVSRLLLWFRANRPEIELQITEDGSTTLLEMVRDGKLDLAFVYTNDAGDLCSYPLFPLRLNAFVAADHWLADHDEIEIRELADEPILLVKDGYQVREIFLSACQIAGIRPKIAIESGTGTTLASLAEAGLGIAVVSDAFRSPGLELKRLVLTLEGEPLKAWMAIVWHPQRYMSPAAKFFIDKAIELIPKNRSEVQV